MCFSFWFVNSILKYYTIIFMLVMFNWSIFSISNFYLIFTCYVWMNWKNMIWVFFLKLNRTWVNMCISKALSMIN
jgi:hypothetical protein